MARFKRVSALSSATHQVTRSRKPASRISALDGLRALSIAFVLAGHGAWTHRAPALLWPLRQMGIVGVELFFAISGFIITLGLLQERGRYGRIDLAQFWLRRALRILPPFTVMCAGVAAAAAAGVIPWSWPSFFGALSFTKNTPLLAGGWFFGHTWSLSLEEQFYLLWPPLLAAIATRRAELLLAALVMAAPALAQGAFVMLPALQNILPYVPDLAAGCWLAVMLQRPDRTFARRYLALPWRVPLLITSVSVALAAAYLHNNGIDKAISAPLDALLTPLAAMALIAELTLHDGRLSAVLSWTPLRALGLVSYSLYLWQQLFFGPPQDYRHVWLWSTWPYNLFAALLCGVLAYWAVERPCAWLKSRWAGRPLASPAVSAA